MMIRECKIEFISCDCFSFLAAVGWYHSHPTFVAQPSVLDIENQSTYQAMFSKVYKHTHQRETAQNTIKKKKTLLLFFNTTEKKRRFYRAKVIRIFDIFRHQRKKPVKPAFFYFI